MFRGTGALNQFINHMIRYAVISAHVQTEDCQASESEFVMACFVLFLLLPKVPVAMTCHF